VPFGLLGGEELSMAGRRECVRFNPAGFVSDSGESVLDGFDCSAILCHDPTYLACSLASLPDDTAKCKLQSKDTMLMANGYVMVNTPTPDHFGVTDEMRNPRRFSRSRTIPSILGRVRADPPGSSKNAEECRSESGSPADPPNLCICGGFGAEEK
jgi:hypothetical protein